MSTKILRFIIYLAKKKKEKEVKEIVIKRINKRLNNLDSYIDL